MRSQGIELIFAESYASVRSAYSLLLQYCGYQVTSLATGGELLQHFAAFNSQLNDLPVILLDPMLSDMWGLDAIQSIRNKHPSIYVVVISGHPKCLEKALDSIYVDLVLSKPASVVHIDNEICRMLARSGMALEI
jgi:CheY-like chemotaxis protein